MRCTSAGEGVRIVKPLLQPPISDVAPEVHDGGSGAESQESKAMNVYS